jgi:hypothetical protein
MKETIFLNRKTICSKCPTPCDIRESDFVLKNPCSSCPLEPQRWGKWDCNEDKLAGDILTEKIDEKILKPLVLKLPISSEVVKKIKKCGGCQQARHALGSKETHTDLGSVI